MKVHLSSKLTFKNLKCSLHLKGFPTAPQLFDSCFLRSSYFLSIVLRSKINYILVRNSKFPEKLFYTAEMTSIFSRSLFLFWEIIWKGKANYNIFHIDSAPFLGAVSYVSPLSNTSALLQPSHITGWAFWHSPSPTLPPLPHLSLTLRYIWKMCPP